MNEKAALFAVLTCDYGVGLVAEAAHEALEFLVVYNAEREDRSRDTLAEGVPHFVAFLTHRGGPAYDANVRDQYLVPTSHVLVNFKPEVVGRVEPVSCD
jgi:hypothetical protein